MVLLLPLSLYAVTPDQQQGRPNRIFFWEVSGEMTEPFDGGDVRG